MKKMKKKGFLLRALTILVMLVMLGSACLPVAALSINAPTRGDSGEPNASLSYSNGMFNVRLNADALYEMLSDRTVTREELTQFIPEDVLALFTEGRPTLEEMRSVLSSYITKDDLKAMVADLPRELVNELFDIEMVTDLVDVNELLAILDMESMLDGIDAEKLLTLVEGEPLKLILQNEELWETVITDEFIEDMLRDPSFLELVQDPEVQENLHALLEDRTKVDYDALLNNEVFVEHVLENEKVLPDLVSALIREGHITDLFTDALMDQMLTDGLLVVNASTIDKLVEIGAVKLDSTTLAGFNFATALNDPDKLQGILDIMFEGTEGQARADALAAALYGDNDLLKDLDIAVLTDLGVVNLNGVDLGTLLEDDEIDLDIQTDVLDYMPGKPSVGAFAQSILNLTGSNAVINTEKFVDEMTAGNDPLIKLDRIDLQTELLSKLTADQKKDLAEHYADVHGIDIDNPSYFDQDALIDDLENVISDDEKLELAEKIDADTLTLQDLLDLADRYGIDPYSNRYFDQDAFINDVLPAMTDDEKKSELMTLVQNGTVTVNDLEAWGAFAWGDITVDVLLSASDDAVNKTNLITYIKNELNAGIGVNNWVQKLYENDKISFDKLKTWGVIRLTSTEVNEILAYRDANDNPLIAPADLLAQDCVKGWLKDTALMSTMLKRGAITTADLKTWGLLDLEQVFHHFDTPAQIEEAGIMTEENLHKVITDYIGFDGIHDFLLGNAAEEIEGHPGAFSAAVDVLIAHLGDIWDDFIHDVDFGSIFLDIQAVAEAITYEKIISHVGIPKLVESVGGYQALLSYYSNDELTAIAKAVGTDRVRAFVKESGILQKFDVRGLINDVVELAKDKKDEVKALANELIDRFTNMLLQGVQCITLDGKAIFVTDEIYGDTATIGQFDVTRIVEILLSALPDTKSFMALGDNADLFELSLGLKLDPDRYETAEYTLGITFGFIGSLNKLQSLVAEYEDLFVLDPEYADGLLSLNVSTELPAVAGVLYEELLKSDDDELHTFLVDLPEATLSEVIEFLAGRTDEKLTALADKLAAGTDTLRNKLSAALDKAGNVGDKLEAGYEAKLAARVDRILEKLTTFEGLRDLRDRAVSLLEKQLGENADATVDSFYNKITGNFEISREIEVDIYGKLSEYITLPEEIMALFTNNMKIDAKINLSLCFATIHRIEVIMADEEPVAQTFSLRGAMFRSTEPVLDPGTTVKVLYAPEGADPAIFRMGTLYDLHHNALTAMPTEDSVIMDDSIRTLVFDYNYDGATDGTVSEPITYTANHETTAIYALPNPADGVTLRNGYHYAWTVNGVEIETIDDLHVLMAQNTSRLVVTLTESDPVIEFYETYEKYSADGYETTDHLLGYVEFKPGQTTYADLEAEILAFLDTNRTDSHTRATTDAELKQMVEQIIADATLSAGGFDGRVDVTYDLKIYNVTLTYGNNTWIYHYKHGTNVLLEGELPTLTPPRGYTVAWPTIDISSNTDVAYEAVETVIEYIVRFETEELDGTTTTNDYVITVETLANGLGDWQAFLDATGAPATPAFRKDFELCRWLLNDLGPDDAAFGFMIPSNTELTLPADPTVPLFVLKAEYTRTHGYLHFYHYNDKNVSVADEYRYELGKETFDATGATYGITIPVGHHLKAFVNDAGQDFAPDMTTAPEDGIYTVYVLFELNEYTVTFYGLDGTTVVETLTFKHGQTTLSGPVPAALTKLGYQAGGWAYESVVITDWTAFLTGKTADLAVYAVLGDPITYQVTFRDAQGDRTVDFTIENYASVTAPEVRSKNDPDYGAGSWVGFDTAELVVISNSEIVAINENVVFEATYPRIAGYITFVDAQGNKIDNAKNPVRFEAGKVTFDGLDLTFLDKPHYNRFFDFEKDTQAKKPDLTQAVDYTVKVTYEAKSYSVSFIADGSVVHTQSYTYTEGVTTMPLPTEVSSWSKLGYTVTWPDTITLAYTDDQKVEATLTKHTYHYEFVDGNTVYGEGTFDIDTESLTEPTLPTIEGYDVLGWEDYTLPFESREAWEDGHVLTIHLNKSLHTYTATFVDGETVLYEKGFTIEDIDTFEAPPVPEKEGFTGAWEPFTLTAADITIRVIWTPVQGEDTKAPDDTTDTEAPPVDPGDQDGNWLWWLLIALLLLIVIALIVIFFILKNKKDDDHNDPEPPAPVVVAEPEPTPEPEPVVEPVVEPEPTPVVVEAEPAVVKVTYLSATSRAVINLCDLDARFEDGDTVNLETLKEMKLVSKKEKRLKVLGSGTITKALTVEADYFSGSAADKIRAAGGTPVQKN